MKTVRYFCYFLFLLAIAFIAYYRVLQFTFYLDDWGFFWNALYHPQTLFFTFLQWGATLEFFVLSKLFGDHVVLWQLFGIVLRAVAAYAVGLMVATVTRVRRAGILAGVFFACLSVGIQSVSWISAHVVDIDVIGVSLTFMLWVTFHRTGLTKYVWYTLGALLFALALDPFRVFPLIVILGMYSLVNQFKMKKSNVHLIRSIIGVVCVAAFIITIWERQYIIESAPYTMIFRSPHVFGLTLLLHGARLIGNYFWSMSNLVFGAFIAPVAPAPHPAYATIPVVVSFVLFLFTLWYSASLWGKKGNERGLYILIFTSWMLIFFIPCWIFEPRQMVEPVHRYLVLPSVGLAALLGYCIAKIKHITLVVIAALAIIAVNISSSYRALTFENMYRSRSLTEQFWKIINASVPDDETQSIFVYQGEEPVRTWTLELSGSRPFAIKRKISEASRVPLTTTDKEQIVRLLCGLKTIPLSHLHVWSVRNDGAITDISQEWRNTIRSILVARECEFEE